MKRNDIRIMKMDRNNRSILMNGAEFRLARNSLNNLRNARITAGGYTDAADAALLKLVKAKPLFWPF